MVAKLGYFLGGKKMQVHRQRCQACQSTTHNNLIVRKPGQPQVIMVRCTRCKALVAQYELESYYHHGKGFESWLASFRGQHESGRRLLEDFRKVQESAAKLYREVLDKLKAEGKE